MATTKDDNGDRKVIDADVFAAIAVDMSDRMIGNMRFGPDKEWLKEAAKSAATTKVNQLLDSITPEEADTIAKYIRACR